MAQGDMRDLVRDHTCQLSLGVHVLDKASVHVDVAPGERERVDVGEVRDPEPVAVGGSRGLGREPLSEALDVAGWISPANEGNATLDLPGGLRTDLHVLLGGEQIESGPDARLRQGWRG